MSMPLNTMFSALLTFPYFPLSAFCVILVGITLTDLYTWLRLPSGPPPLFPFIGNKHQLPKRKPWIQFEAWAKQYGSIFTLFIGRTPTLIVSDPSITTELLERRSQRYSSRPRTIAMGELYWDNASILVQPYGRSWSVRRRLLHQALSLSALRLYKPTQEAEASRLCAHLLHNPEKYERHIDRFAASIVFSIAYGRRVDSLDAQVIRNRLEFMQYSASLNVPGKYMVETLPILKHIPDFLAGWKRKIKSHGRLEAAENIALVDLVRSDVSVAKERGSQPPDSLCKMLLDVKEREGVPLSERDFSFIPASLFGAGSDTTASTLCSFVLAVVTHPDVLSAAQAEVDAVVGHDRSPTFEDEPQLPYITALVKETLRWRPVAVLGGTPHATSEADTYNGWRIPKGTTILGNSWAINHNPDYYPEPDEFEPMRFLQSVPRYLPRRALLEESMENLKGKPHPSKTGHSTFGWGRRICPGEGLAEHSLFIAVAKLCWGFDISAAPGYDYDTMDYTEGFNVRPKPFVCSIRCRTNQEETLRGEAREAEKYMERFPVFE